jgi:hypothetical protein
MNAFARLVGPVPGQDHPIKLQNLLLQAVQLSAERGKTLRPTCRYREVQTADSDSNTANGAAAWVPRIVRLAAPPASSETKTGHDPPKEAIIFCLLGGICGRVVSALANDVRYEVKRRCFLVDIIPWLAFAFVGAVGMWATLLQRCPHIHSPGCL